MLTKWAKEIMVFRNNTNQSPLPAGSYPSPSSQKTTVPAKKVDGTALYISPFLYDGFSTTLRNYNPLSSTGIYVGSDGTPATDEDYTLGSVLTSISGNTNLFFQQDSNNDTLCCMDISIRNTSSSEITIREIGYVCMAYTGDTEGSAGSSSRYGSFLMDRTVLDTPMTIAAGDSGLIRYKFKYSASE